MIHKLNWILIVGIQEEDRQGEMLLMVKLLVERIVCVIQSLIHFKMRIFA